MNLQIFPCPCLKIKQAPKAANRTRQNVTLRMSHSTAAVFYKQDTLKKAQEVNAKTRGFPSSPHNEFGFFLEYASYLPTGEPHPVRRQVGPF